MVTPIKVKKEDLMKPIKRPYKCSKCSWSFTSKERLDGHLRDHEVWEREVKKLGSFTVACRDFWDGVDYLLNKYESYPEPYDDVQVFYGANASIVTIMTPIGDIWTFEIQQANDGAYFVKLIGNSYLLKVKWGKEKIE
jgi:hypothetical protein